MFPILSILPLLTTFLHSTSAHDTHTQPHYHQHHQAPSTTPCLPLSPSEHLTILSLRHASFLTALSHLTTELTECRKIQYHMYAHHVTASMSPTSEETASMFPSGYQGLVDMTRGAWERQVSSCDVLEKRVDEVERWIGEVETARQEVEGEMDMEMEMEIGCHGVEEMEEMENMQDMEDKEDMEGAEGMEGMEDMEDTEGKWVCAWLEEAYVEEFQSMQEVGLVVG